MISYKEQVLDDLDMMQYELCADCGYDADWHTISPGPFGEPHIWCLREPRDVGQDVEENEPWRKAVVALVEAFPDNGHCPRCSLSLEAHLVGRTSETDPTPAITCPQGS